MGIGLSHYKKYSNLMRRYYFEEGEGYSLATQTVNALNNLVSGWYYELQIFDNYRGELKTITNRIDLSPYANWIWKNHSDTREILQRIWECKCYDDYECLLADLTKVLIDKERLKFEDGLPMRGSIHDCIGVFKYILDDDIDEYD